MIAACNMNASWKTMRNIFVRKVLEYKFIVKVPLFIALTARLGTLKIFYWEVISIYCYLIHYTFLSYLVA